MESVAVSQISLPDMTFTGRLLFDDSAVEDREATQGRSHTVAIYETELGGLIMTIQYHSPFDSEPPFSLTDSASNAEEVDATLSLYEPTARICSQLFHNDVSGRDRIATAMTAQFDAQVSRVLGKLNRSTVNRNTTSNEVAGHATSKKSKPESF